MICFKLGKKNGGAEPPSDLFLFESHFLASVSREALPDWCKRRPGRPCITSVAFAFVIMAGYYC